MTKYILVILVNSSIFLYRKIAIFRHINVFAKAVDFTKFLSVAFYAQYGKMKNLLSPIRKFRQINSLVFSVVKTLLSRNFCQRSVTVNFPQCGNYRILLPPFFRSVQFTQCGNYGNLLSHFFDKNFVKVTFLLKKILKSWFDEIFYGWQ